MLFSCACFAFVFRDVENPQSERSWSVSTVTHPDKRIWLARVVRCFTGVFRLEYERKGLSSVLFTVVRVSSGGIEYRRDKKTQAPSHNHNNQNNSPNPRINSGWSDVSNEPARFLYSQTLCANNTIITYTSNRNTLWWHKHTRLVISIKLCDESRREKK